jgi:hypothetical protein
MKRVTAQTGHEQLVCGPSAFFIELLTTCIMREPTAGAQCRASPRQGLVDLLAAEVGQLVGWSGS